MKRRKFLAGAAGATAAASSAFSPLTFARNKKYTFDMVTSWPTALDTLYGTAQYFGKALEAATDGDVTVNVYPAGAQVGALEVFDAVSSGAFAMGHTASYYYIGKNAAHAFFTAVPFGLTPTEQNAWLESGGGEALWNELNGKSGMVAFAAGNTGAQTGGWFNKQINSPADLKGLKMRFPGLGGQVMSRAGVNIQNLPGGQIYFALNRGVIDAADWVSPYDDEILKLYRAAKYYYMPSWAEPGPTVGVYVNKSVYQGLPKDLQQAIRTVAHAANERMLSQYTAKNGPALERLIKKGVKIRTFPPDVLALFRKYTDQILEENAKKDAFYSKLYTQWRDFRESVRKWDHISDYTYQRFIYGDMGKTS